MVRALKCFRHARGDAIQTRSGLIWRHHEPDTQCDSSFPLTLFTTIFKLPFEGVNFSRGIVLNSGLDFRKDAAYELLRNPRHNWRKFVLALAAIMVRFLAVLTDDDREKVLILDDSTYDRSRSKKVELLSWIHDHNTGRSLKGFKLMTLGWSDGNSFLPLDFVLCASANAEKRLQGIAKELDKR